MYSDYDQNNNAIAIEFHIFQLWNSEELRVLCELTRHIHRQDDVTGVLYMDFVFNFILCEEAILIAFRRSLSSTDLIHLIGRLHRFPCYGLTFVIDKDLRWRIRDMLDHQNSPSRLVYPGLAPYSER